MGNRRRGDGTGVESNTVDVVVRKTAERKNNGPHFALSMLGGIFLDVEHRSPDGNPIRALALKHPKVAAG
jgi:hypothetical protein